MNRTYSRAIVTLMAEVLDKAPDEDARAALLETADYWLQLGLAIGVKNPKDARRLLSQEEEISADRDPAFDAAEFLNVVKGSEKPVAGLTWEGDDHQGP